MWRAEPGWVVQERLKLRLRLVISQDVGKFPPRFHMKKRPCPRRRLDSVTAQFSTPAASAVQWPPRGTKSVRSFRCRLEGGPLALLDTGCAVPLKSAPSQRGVEQWGECSDAPGYPGWLTGNVPTPSLGSSGTWHPSLCPPRSSQTPSKQSRGVHGCASIRESILLVVATSGALLSPGERRQG